MAETSPLVSGILDTGFLAERASGQILINLIYEEWKWF